MTRAVLSLGSNLGDRLAHLKLAVDGLADAVQAVSHVYETEPWGVTDQPMFLNAVVLVEDDDRDEWAWLATAQALEHQAQRVREQRWGPRTLDVDIVTVDGVTSGDERLLLPHPGTPERSSVLVPWLDVDPDAVLPGHGRVADLLAQRDPDERAGVRRRDDMALTGT